MSCSDRVTELLPGYALNCLDEAEQISVSEHLAICATCRSEARAYQAIVAQLALTVPKVGPSPDLTQRLMKRIQRASPDFD
jgi:anti-sigma factor RsiW